MTATYVSDVAVVLVSSSFAFAIYLDVLVVCHYKVNTQISNIDSISQTTG